MDALEVSREGKVATVTLVGPGKGNALGPAFFAEMPELFRKLDADDAVRAIVLRGGGKAFTYGLDLMARARAGLRHVALWNSAFLPSADLGEAFAAFAEKRTPRFEGK